MNEMNENYSVFTLNSKVIETSFTSFLFTYKELEILDSLFKERDFTY
jgi:hypothetical protein